MIPSRDHQSLSSKGGVPLTSNITGRREIGEGSYENMKNSRLRKQVEAKHGVTSQKC